VELPAAFPREIDVLACDLDRTLIADDLVFRPRTKAALSAARGAGVPVVIVTGRMVRAVRPYLEDAGLDGPVVCYQGAVVADSASRQWLRHEPIPLELAREAVAAVVAEGHHLNVYVDDELYVAEITPEARAYADFQRLPIHPVGDLLAWLSDPPTKLVSVGDPVELDRLEARLTVHFDGRLYISKSLPHFLEFAAPGVTKAAGMEFLAERLGFARERTVAFGDGENDVELLDWAGYGVAVANAHDRVLAVADWVCPGPQDEGVAQVLEAWLAGRS
jgi:Cof subfamily protein (haloacid dehalogenase superfamily)